MPKYEYEVDRYPSRNDTPLQRLLDKRAEEGWRLVGMGPNGGTGVYAGSVLIFEREKP